MQSWTSTDEKCSIANDFVPVASAIPKLANRSRNIRCKAYKFFALLIERFCGNTYLIPLVAPCQIPRIASMGIVRTRSMTPDLFSQVGETPPATLPTSRTGSPTSRHVLPKDLPKAIRQLENRELDELLSAVLAEQKRRKLPTAEKLIRKRQVEEVPLTTGKVNAVRAAFSAGVTPSRIARQFGLSQSQVRKAFSSR